MGMTNAEITHAGDDYLLPICGADPPDENLTVAFIEAQVTCPACIKIQERHA